MSLIGQKRIVRRPEAAVSSALADLHPVLARVCAARRIGSADELEHGLAGLLPYHDLAGIDRATALLAQALEEGWRILIVGDFDADGATSTAVAVRALRSLGAADVGFLVPNRFEYGYGLTPEIVAVAAGQRPDLIVTVDNGISSLDGVAAANAAGIRVLITDHHLPAEQLPAAAATVNPNQPGDTFPSKSLAGVGVIFYLMLALRARLREVGWFAERGIDEPNLAQLLDLVALGTVADVVPLDRNNRILVHQGLARIRAGQASPGIRALIAIARRNPERLVSADLGYAVGPRLNAAGRMHDMSLGIRCLLADDPAQARHYAGQLEELNKERRGTEEVMREQAFEVLRQMHLEANKLPFGLCLYDPDWHEGVIGILASRVKDRVHRPVIVFTDSADGLIKGSARSVPGLHIRDALDAVAAHHPGLLVRFGGHAMAAGLTLAAEDLNTFRHAFDAEVRRVLTEDDLQGILHTDGPLAAAELTEQLAETLRYIPWGQGFPEPVFDGEFHVVNRRIVGERHLKLTLKQPGHTTVIDAIAFNAAEDAPTTDHLHCAYRVDLNEYNGRRSLQLIIEHLEPAQTPTVVG